MLRLIMSACFAIFALFHGVSYGMNEDEEYEPSFADLIQATTSGNMHELNKMLLDPRFDPNKAGNGALITAAIHGYHQIVDRLLKDSRIDPSTRDNKALVYAAQYGHLETVNRLLQDKRVNPGARQNDALIYSAYFGHLPVVERLLKDKRVYVMDQGNAAVRNAYGSGHCEIAFLILEHYPLIDALILAKDISMPGERPSFDIKYLHHLFVKGRPVDLKAIQRIAGLKSVQFDILQYLACQKCIQNKVDPLTKCSTFVKAVMADKIAQELIDDNDVDNLEKYIDRLWDTSF